ncbi:MAG: CoA-binding protein [Thermotogae bacterium]|nr:CoA-binding protein [Thermotogota bacterium]
MTEGNEKVCVQGITGKYGKFHTEKMLKYGTNIVCGVSKNSSVKEIAGVPVLNSAEDAVKIYKADTSVVFVPARFAKDAVTEAIYAGIKKIIIITEHIPIHDMIEIYSLSKEKNVKIIGPNCPGIIIPSVLKIGIMPEKAFKPGDIAIISKSGTLMYEVANQLSVNSSGIKIAIGLGGDPVTGTNVSEAFDYIIKKGIKKTVLIGEPGGNEEIKGIKHAIDKGYDGKIKTFFAGKTAPEGKTMGHAGAIVEGREGSIAYKESYLKSMGIDVSEKISDLVF